MREGEAEMKIDPLGVFATAVCAFLIALMGCGLYVAAQERKWLQENSCVLQSETDTGKRVYCGKACFRPEKRKEYRCSFGQHIIIR